MQQFFFDPDNLKILAAISSIIGSIILAVRVRNILSALSFVAKMHESNINEIASRHQDIVIATGATNHVERAQGMALLIIGFLFLGLSGVLNLIALLLQN